jgi:hypothetical protein
MSPGFAIPALALTLVLASIPVLRADVKTEESNPATVGGAIGGFMKRRAQANAEKNGNSPRTMFMTINHEVLSISAGVSAADVAIPAGFKLNK